MADLQAFDKLFKSLQDEVAALDKQKGNLTLECNTLKARHKFLSQEIKKLETSRDNLIKQQAEAAELLKSNQEQSSQAISAAEADVAKVRREYKVTLSGLNDQQKALETELDYIRQQIKAKLRYSDDLTGQTDTLKANIVELNKTINAKTDQIKKLDSEVDDKKAAVDQEIGKLNAQKKQAEEALALLRDEVLVAQNSVSEWSKKLTAIQGEVSAAKQKHEKFTAYEVRARKALRNYENSLKERERQLEVRLVTSRRRNDILDNVE